MAKDDKDTKSEIALCVFVLGIIVSVSFASFVKFYQEPRFEKFRKEGQAVSATVMIKRKKSSGKSYNYYFDIMFFTKAETTRETIDLGMGEVEWPVHSIGESTSAEVEVGKDRYDAASTGDRIGVTYLKNERTDVKLTSVVENADFSNAYVFSGLIFLLAVFSGVYWFRRRKLNEPTPVIVKS